MCLLKLLGSSKGYAEENYDVHISRFSLRSAVKILLLKLARSSRACMLFHDRPIDYLLASLGCG